MYNQVVDRIESVIADQTKVEVDVKNLDAKTTNLHLEKIKMPWFSGELREYPRFRKDFEVQVMPSLNSSTACYTLRSCLCEGPLVVVRGVDDDIDEMWRRLDEKYGDPAKITDVIINSIQRVKAIKEGEDKRCAEFVEIIESGYRDLLRLGVEKEITTTSSVSIIKKRLPADIRREWSRLVSSDSSSVYIRKTNFQASSSFCLTRKGQSNMIYQICERPEVSEVKRANSLFIVLMQWLKILRKTSSSLLKARVAVRACFSIVPATEPMNANYTYPRLVVSKWTCLEKRVHAGLARRLGIVYVIAEAGKLVVKMVAQGRITEHYTRKIGKPAFL